MTHDKLPSAAEVEDMARRCENVYQGDHPGDMNDAAKMLRYIAVHLRQREDAEQRKGEPVAWQFQQSETGLMCELSNDGINTPESFLANNPRHRYIGPLHTAPPSADAEDARRYRWLRDIGLDENGWHLSQELDNGMEEVHLFPDRIDAAIDAAMRGESQS